nr:translation initiation factor IF-2-like [Equus asinus]
MNVGDAATSVAKKGQTHTPGASSISGSFHKRRFPAQGVGGRARLEKKPGEARSPGDSARGMEASLGCAGARGAPGAATRGVWRRGRARPPFPGRRVTPPLLPRGSRQPCPPHPRNAPASLRTARRPGPRPRPGVTATAPSPGRGGGHRQAASPGAAGAGPRAGSASGRTNKAAGAGRGGAGPAGAAALTGGRPGRLAAAGTAAGRAPRRGRRRRRAGGGGAAGPGARGGGARRRAGLDSAAGEVREAGRRGGSALGGRGRDAAAFPFSRPGPCSPAASSSLGPRRRRRLSLGSSRASPRHQGRADPQGPSWKVRGCRRLPQLRTQPASFPSPCAQLLSFPSPSPRPLFRGSHLSSNFSKDSAEKGQLGSALLNPTPICGMLSDRDGGSEDCVNFTPAGVQKDCPHQLFYYAALKLLMVSCLAPLHHWTEELKSPVSNVAFPQ